MKSSKVCILLNLGNWISTAFNYFVIRQFANDVEEGDEGTELAFSLIQSWMWDVIVKEASSKPNCYEREVIILIDDIW